MAAGSAPALLRATLSAGYSLTIKGAVWVLYAGRNVDQCTRSAFRFFQTAFLIAPAFYIAGMDVSEEEKERLYFTAAQRPKQTLS